VHTDTHAPCCTWCMQRVDVADVLQVGHLVKECCSQYCTCVEPAVLVNCLLLKPVVLLHDVGPPHLHTAQHSTAQHATT
jgi:hypothetical protein